MRRIQSAVRLTLAASLLATTFGFRAAEAMAAVVVKTGPAAPRVQVSPVQLGFSAPAQGLNLTGANALSLPTLSTLNQNLPANIPAIAPSAVSGDSAAASVRPSAAAREASAAAAPTAAGSAVQGRAVAAPRAVAGQNAAPKAAASAQEAAAQRAAQSNRERSFAAIGAHLEGFKISPAGAESAHGFAAKLEGLLTQSQQGARAGGLEMRYSFSESGGRQFGAPAGRGSIDAAVRSHPSEPAVPKHAASESPASGGVSGGGSDNGDGSMKNEEAGNPASLPARIFAAALAGLPAIFITEPLMTGGAFWVGAAVLAASLGLMTIPFMGAKTPRVFRRAPGLLLSGLGLFTLVNGLLGGPGALMGGLVLLGGWGLYRFAGAQNDRFFDEEKLLTAYFGALSAVLGAGLVALTPAVLAASWLGGLAFLTSAWFGWTLWGAGLLAYPLSAMLLMHLPGWVGAGIEAAARGIFETQRAAWRVLGSIKNDTVLRRRLEVWTKAKLKLSKWNVFKVGAVWAPAWIVEGVKLLVSGAAALVMGLAQAPVMFLWGAAHKLWPQSRATKFLASWNHSVFYYGAASKKSVYNNAAVIALIRGANSESSLKSFFAGAGLLIAQVLWAAYAVIATPFLHAGGFFYAFTRTGGAYDKALHDPNEMDVDREDSPVARPDVPETPAVDWVPPGLFATALALIPLYFFGLPLLAFPLLGWPYILSAVGLGLMPLVSGHWPKLVRQLPGYFMMGLGAAMLVSVPWLSFGPVGLLALLKSNAMWMGLTVLFSGAGFAHNITKMSDEKEGQRRWSVDDPEYIGAYLGALGVLIGAGSALLSVGGLLGFALSALGYLTSILLLIHLPRWLWDGVRAVLSGWWGSVSGFHKILNFWEKDTSFYKNLRAQKDYHLKGSFWEVMPKGILLGFIWVPLGLMMLAEYLGALALGSLLGLVRAPLNWAWGAAYKVSPDGKFTRFLAGWGRTWYRWMEGGKTKFLAKTPLLGWMSAASGAAGSPTLGAYAAFAAARILQLIGLAVMLAAAPFVGLAAVVGGLRGMAGEKKKPAEGEWFPDEDRPVTVY